MDRCCEQLTRNVKDCNIMQLLGGDMGLLNTKSTKNVTLLYPNMVFRLTDLTPSSLLPIFAVRPQQKGQVRNNPRVHQRTRTNVRSLAHDRIQHDGRRNVGFDWLQQRRSNRSVRDPRFGPAGKLRTCQLPNEIFGLQELLQPEAQAVPEDSVLPLGS